MCDVAVRRNIVFSYNLVSLTCKSGVVRRHSELFVAKCAISKPKGLIGLQIRIDAGTREGISASDRLAGRGLANPNLDPNARDRVQ